MKWVVATSESSFYVINIKGMKYKIRKQRQTIREGLLRL